MLKPINDYFFVEEVECSEITKTDLIIDGNLSREKIIRAKIFVECEEEDIYISDIPAGTEVLCDIVGAREFNYNGKKLYIVTKDSIFGVMGYGKLGLEKTKEEIITQYNTEGGNQ